MWKLIVIALLFITFSAFPMHMRRRWGKLVGWACERCGKRFKDGWLLEFHHKVPTSNGGKDTYDNIECLCVRDHAMAHEDLARNGLGHPKSAGLIWYRLRKTKGGRTKKWLDRHK